MNVGGLLALSIGCALAQPTPPTWTHNPASQNGPLHWGNVTPSYETCGNAPLGLPTMVPVGMAQTPVNIVYSPSMIGVAVELTALHFVTKLPMNGTYIVDSPLVSPENATQYYFPNSPY